MRSRRFTASATESGRTAPQGRRGGEGRLGACRPVCSLTRTANTELQLQGWTPSTDPEHRNCLLNASGSVRLQSLLVSLIALPLARNPALPQAFPTKAIFPRGFSKALPVGSTLGFWDGPHEKARSYYSQTPLRRGDAFCFPPTPQKSAGAAGSQHDNKRESISSTIPPNPSKSPSPGAPLGDFQSICSLAGMLLGPTSKICSSLRAMAMALPQDAFQRQEESSKEVLRKVIYVL